ncbi:MAG: MerR family transcriptional regulator [Defluviitaleaceae bacterium]|nr:MerR family transcriptional regulator [Defluviitaleaceae bacterium]
MSRKSNLISIGDLSKITGAGIKSLRYYERINVLKPAYVSPDTGYRYYTLDQSHMVEMIMLCIELDIPLSEMSKFVDNDGTMDLIKFLKKGREIAEKKIVSLKKGLELIDKAEQQIELAEQHNLEQIYTRKIPQKNFSTLPCGDSLENIDRMKMLKSYGDISWAEDDFGFFEYGIMRKNDMYSYFIEIPRKTENQETIPQGIYYCIQLEESQIENAAEIFKEYISGEFLAIETEIFTSRQNVNKPVNELRLINL